MTQRIEPCACMGALHGEPHCYCEMQRRGLPLNRAARDAEHARAKAQWEQLCAPGGPFAAQPPAAASAPQ